MKVKLKSQKGAITLIVLVAMLFLTMFLMSMYIILANEAQTSAETTKKIAEKYNNISDVGYEAIELPEGWGEIENPEGWSDKVTAITDGTHIVPLPNGYEIIEGVEGETSVEKGLVIKDRYDNEFVWTPVTEDLNASYSSSSSYSEPKALTYIASTYGNNAYDSQGMLDYLYGENYYNYSEDFNYADDYAKMVASVNKYNGFYIGRYETTIDEEGNIGSKYNTEVLTAGSILKEGTNPNTSEKYYYQWYGLYYATKNANVEGNGDYVQTSMIWGQQWDVMIEYFNNKSIDYSAFGTTSGVIKSGQSTNSNGNKDEIYNIYDLRTNCREWTAEANRHLLSRS